MRIVAYSKALYATWVHLEPLHLLLDAGEGVNTHLEGRLIGLRDVFLTHGHTDHFTGLQNVLVTMLRHHQRDPEMPPLNVYYPGGEPEIERYLAYLSEAHLARTPSLARFVPLAPGDTVTLAINGRVGCAAFRVEHRPSQLSLGYRLFERRWVLRPEVQALPQTELNRRAARLGRESVATLEERTLVCYSGDTTALPVDEARGADVLIHEATFLEGEAEHGHSTLRETLATWRAAGAARLILMHLSSRYGPATVERVLQQAVPLPAERERIHVLLPGERLELDLPAGSF